MGDIKFNMAYVKRITGRDYLYRYDDRSGAEVYVGPVEPAQSPKNVLDNLDDGVAEEMCTRFVAGDTFKSIREYLRTHGVTVCAATVKRFMVGNGITRYMH